MPIRPENRDRYPDDWPAISARVREKAGYKCEWCGVENGKRIRRGTSRCGRAVLQPADATAYCNGFCAETGVEVEDSTIDTVDYRDPVKVVLTVAHLDHQPENCARDNLRALCQRCHNAYDAPMRAKGIAERKRAACAVKDLFDPEADT